MKLKVMYHSRSGNTKKVADAIAQSLGQTAEAIPPAYPLENISVLFLGGAVYMGKADAKVREFIRTLNASRVKNVALFGTTGNQDKALTEMRDLLKSKGINVLDDTFLCKGKTMAFFNRKHPSAEDLKAAQEFAQKVVGKIKE